MEHKQFYEKYKKYKSKYIYLKNSMFGGDVIEGCCKKDCGRKINRKININIVDKKPLLTCCDKCKSKTGLHDVDCDDIHVKCNNCNRKAACKDKNNQYPTCCSGCPSHTPVCNARNPSVSPSVALSVKSSFTPSIASSVKSSFTPSIASSVKSSVTPHIIVGEPWGDNSAYVTVYGFNYKQTERPAHVNFGGKFPKPGTRYNVGPEYDRGNAKMRNLLDDNGKITPYHITVDYKK